jgi:thioredoxin-related protein
MNKLGFTLMATVALATAAWADEATWLTDLAKAKALAKQEKKMVLMDFTGSDWCPPCRELHKNVLTAKEFVDYAKSNLVLVLVDFPTHKPLPPEQEKANEALRLKFKVDGYPTVIVLDPNGKQLSFEAGYLGTSAKEFVANLQKLKKQS